MSTPTLNEPELARRRLKQALRAAYVALDIDGRRDILRLVDFTHRIISELIHEDRPCAPPSQPLRA